MDQARIILKKGCFSDLKIVEMYGLVRRQENTQLKNLPVGEETWSTESNYITERSTVTRFKPSEKKPSGRD